MRIIRTFYLFTYIFLLCCIAFLSPTTTSAETIISNEQTLNETEEFYNKLDGDWILFPEQFVMPDQIRTELQQDNGKVVSIPGSFEQHTGKANTYGTYTTTVRIPQNYVGETLAIYIPFQYSAYSLFIDEKEMMSTGTVSDTPEDHKAEMAPRTGYFIAESDEIELTMHVSSFDHIRGGFENTIYLGDASVVSKKNNTKMILTLFINGSIFIAGLFMVLFSLYRRQEKLFLFFGLFAMLISVRALFTVPFYYTIIFENMSWLWGTRMEYIFTEATSMLFVILLWKWHEKEFSKLIMYFLVAVHLITIAVTLFTQPVFFQAFFFNVFYLAIPTFFYALYVIIKSIRNNNRIAKINVIGMLLIFIAFFNDFAIGNRWYDSVTLMLPAVGIYVLIHVNAMSKDFAERANEIEQQYEELIALNNSNEELAVQLQNEVKQKDDFLANTSHELRNPLHGILNISQAMLRHQKDYLSEYMQENLQLQVTIGHHMRQTLDDLLDMTRLKEKRIELHVESLQIQGVASGVIDMLKVLIDYKDIQMHIDIPSDFPNVVADDNRLIQILFNLLHNAVKFTEAGRIMIQATQENDMAQIHITDTGIGIDDATLETIFEPYTQGDSSMTAIGGGLGLGLNIARKLVELHGGTLHATSVVGEGSTFTFTLPIADEAITTGTNDIVYTETDELAVNFMNEHTIHPSPNDHFIENVPYADRPKILAVDDDPINLKVLTNMLTASHYDVTTVKSGEAALQQLKTKDWDLVISDVMMPKMSGYELTQVIRESYSIVELPILLLTARGNADDISSGFLAGANDYVTKPVDAVELNARVHVLTHLQTTVKERLSMEAAWLQAQIRPHFILNTLNAIVSLSVTDTDRMTRLITEFAHYLQRSFYLKNVDRLVPLQDEISLLESYLYIEKERFGERLHIDWDIDELCEEPNVMIPPLALQTIVENAVNHGVLEKLSGGTVTIYIHQDKEKTTFKIIDDGVGMDEETVADMFTIQQRKLRGIGIVNTEQRLKQLFGKGLQVTSTPDVGTTVSFEVPHKGIDNIK